MGVDLEQLSAIISLLILKVEQEQGEYSRRQRRLVRQGVGSDWGGGGGSVTWIVVVLLELY